MQGIYIFDPQITKCTFVQSTYPRNSSHYHIELTTTNYEQPFQTDAHQMCTLHLYYDTPGQWSEG